MRIVKLPDGRLRIPMAAAGEGWAADGTEIIGADDPRYPDYLPLALTEDEHAARDRENASANAWPAGPVGNPLRSPARPPDSVIAGRQCERARHGGRDQASFCRLRLSAPCLPPCTHRLSHAGATWPDWRALAGSAPGPLRRLGLAGLQRLQGRNFRSSVTTTGLTRRVGHALVGGGTLGLRGGHRLLPLQGLCRPASGRPIASAS